MEKILVLNSDYTPLNVTDLKRGFNLILNGRAEMLHHDDINPIRTSSRNFKRPTIIRLLNYVYLKYKKVPLSRYNIYRRDGHRCVYCSTKEKLTLDHVFPKSRGGKNSWLNLVTCCSPCNAYKGNRTPDEAGMEMINKPYRPNYINFMSKVNGTIPEGWKPYIFMG